jgi:hypothetical protein
MIPRWTVVDANGVPTYGIGPRGDCVRAMARWPEDGERLVCLTERSPAEAAELKSLRALAKAVAKWMKAGGHESSADFNLLDAALEHIAAALKHNKRLRRGTK